MNEGTNYEGPRVASCLICGATEDWMLGASVPADGFAICVDCSKDDQRRTAFALSELERYGLDSWAELQGKWLYYMSGPALLGRPEPCCGMMEFVRPFVPLPEAVLADAGADDPYVAVPESPSLGTAL